MLVYSEQTTDFDKKHSYRNPAFWAGEVEKYDEVVIVGDYPEIAKAYKAADKKVTIKAPKKAVKAKAKAPAENTPSSAGVSEE